MDLIPGPKGWPIFVLQSGFEMEHMGHPLGLVKCGQKNPVPVSRFFPNGRPNVRRAPDLQAAFEPAFFSTNSNPSLLEGIRSVIHLVLAGLAAALGLRWLS